MQTGSRLVLAVVTSPSPPQILTMVIATWKLSYPQSAIQACRNGWNAPLAGVALLVFQRCAAGHPKERERWFQFKQDRLQQRMLDWLEAQGITPL